MQKPMLGRTRNLSVLEQIRCLMSSWVLKRSWAALSSILVVTLIRKTCIVDVNLLYVVSLFAEKYGCEFSFIADMHFNRVSQGKIYERNAKENTRENLLSNKLHHNCNLRI